MTDVVAVIGAGNVGCALAVDLALRGIEVRLCARTNTRLEPIRAAGEISVSGTIEGSAAVRALTTSIAKAVAGANIVAVTVPTPALPFVARDLISACTENQLLWLNPGHSGGGLYLAAEMRRAGRAGMRVCQLSTASHAARMLGPSAVRVFNRPSATLAAMPSRALASCWEDVDRLLPDQFAGCDSVIEVDLMNINAVIHPAQMIGNAGWIEATNGDFEIYREGTGPAVGNVIDAVDTERLRLASVLSVNAQPLPGLLREMGFTEGSWSPAHAARSALKAGRAFRGVKAPPTLDHRYIHEDVGWGLVPWAGLARQLGLETPTMDALIQLAGVMNDTNYRTTGLTIQRMGLESFSAEQVDDYVSSGLIGGKRTPDADDR